MTNEQREKDLNQFEEMIKAKLANAPTPEAYETLNEFKEVLSLGWLLACEYKQEEINQLKVENRSLFYERMVLSEIVINYDEIDTIAKSEGVDYAQMLFDESKSEENRLKYQVN